MNLVVAFRMCYRSEHCLSVPSTLRTFSSAGVVNTIHEYGTDNRFHYHLHLYRIVSVVSSSSY